MTLRIPIEDVRPCVQGGCHAGGCHASGYPSKAVVGEATPVSAVAYREGHGAIGVDVVWRGPAGRPRRTRMRPGHDDTWHAVITPDTVGEWTFAVEAFADPYLSWRDAVVKKIEAGQGPQDLANDLAEGAALLDRAAAEHSEHSEHGAALGPQDRVRLAAAALRDERIPLGARVSPALDLGAVMWERPVRDLVSTSAPHRVWADRARALFSAWYEMFPRSEGARAGRRGKPASGTFRTAAKRLPGVAAMGFDVVYLPPIHPIGEVNRKGKNNALVAAPDDVGSPWAIGSAAGGHDAIHPDLGTLDDFRFFVAAARDAGLEVALDLALQCAPDHPWVRSHPEWFTAKPDGTIAYAENPPKKYQDIYPLDFDKDPDGIRAEVLRVVRHWIAQGVKIFRVDNPHTKPFDFWHWLIWEIKGTDPDVLFLAEAFTRPALMHGLAKLGFTQSYTYFTWRTAAWELRQYCEELVAAADVMRPNFWPNTPDILHESLRRGGPPMFRIRAVLASMLSPSWGVYAGYELYEHEARPGSEEYLDNEKYQLKPRDWTAAKRSGQSLAPYLATLNRVRRDNPALHWLRNLRFHALDNDAMLCWSKRDEATGNTVLIVCCLDPANDQWANTTLDMPALGFDWHERFTVVDELTGARYDWGQHNTVHLDPSVEPAHIFTVRRTPPPAVDEGEGEGEAKPALVEKIIMTPPRRTTAELAATVDAVPPAETLEIAEAAETAETAETAEAAEIIEAVENAEIVGKSRWRKA